MNRKWQNVFFAFGIAALALMVTQIDLVEAKSCLLDAGLRFPSIMLLWAILYVLNTASWFLIINASGSSNIGFWWLYKVTLSGFALNYATPMGLMGGEPYRIMELSPVIGTERASSSVILYVMTHIFSHFCFWSLALVLFILTQEINRFMAAILIATALFCVLGICFFISGYRHGLAVRLTTFMSHVPLVGRWTSKIIKRHIGKLETIDRQIAALHKYNRKILLCAVLLELACRVFSAAEVYIVMSLLVPGISFSQSVLVLAFTSLFANLLFFLPLQIGGREGGFLMSAAGLGMSASAGVFTALIIRLRELAWTGIGLLLIKCSRRRDIV